MDLLKSSSKFSKKQLILLSIPVFFSNIAIPLVGIIDTGLMGNLGQTKYLAATSISTSVITMIVWSFGFLRMGTVGIVAQAYGRSDYREIVKTILRNLIIALVAALAVTTGGLGLSLTGIFDNETFAVDNSTILNYQSPTGLMMGHLIVEAHDETGGGKRWW